MDVSGTLEVTSDSGTLRRVNGAMCLSGIALDVKNVSIGGQTIIECAGGFTGDFAEGGVVPKSYVVSKSTTTVRLIQRGLMIIVK